MPEFEFQAVDSSQSPCTGRLTAADRDAARATLEAQGLAVRMLEQVGGDGRNDAANSEERPVVLSDRDFQVVSAHIADITHAQLPLPGALTAMAMELPRGRLKRALIQMSGALSRGKDLEAVLRSHRAPGDMQALIKAGARTGQTDQILCQYVFHQRAAADMKFNTIIAIAYPLTVLVVCCAIIGWLMLWAVPSFVKIFADFGTELPAVTQILISISRGLMAVVTSRTLWWGVAIVAGVLFILRIVLGKAGWRVLLRWIPMYGRMLHWGAMSQFAHLMAILVEHEVPLPEAVSLAGSGSGDAAIRRAGNALAKSFAAEEATPLTRYTVLMGFPVSMIQLLSRQKRTGAIPEALRGLAEIFASRAATQGHVIAIVCGPIIITITGIVLGLAVIALFMPLIKLITDLS